MSSFYEYMFSGNSNPKAKTEKVVEDNKDSYNTKKYYTVCCKDGDHRLLDLINYIGKNGNGGHSFDIVVDPKSDNERHFFWDGDGSDRIISVVKTTTDENKELVGILLEAILGIDRETWIEGSSETIDKEKLILALTNIQDTTREILHGAEYEDSMKEALREVRYALDSKDSPEKKLNRIKDIVKDALE